MAIPTILPFPAQWVIKKVLWHVFIFYQKIDNGFQQFFQFFSMTPFFFSFIITFEI